MSHGVLEPTSGPQPLVEAGLYLAPVADPPGLLVRGAVDVTTHSQWERGLAALPANDHELRLDLRDLAFIDARGVAVLVATAQRLPRSRRLRLDDPPAGLRRMLNLLWPDGVPTMTWDDA